MVEVCFCVILRQKGLDVSGNAMQTTFSLNCSIFTQARIIRQSCLCHGAELQINCWQSSHKSPAQLQLQVPERRNPANQIKFQTQDNLFMRLQRTFDWLGSGYWVSSLLYVINELQTAGCAYCIKVYLSLKTAKTFI